MSKSLSKNNPALQVGLTGGIGAGKTTIGEVFQALGVPVFNADDAGREVLNADTEVCIKVCKLIGDEAYLNGAPDRAFIASRVFNSDNLREGLNNIIHPAVAEMYQTWLNQYSSHPYIIKESAIVFEIGLNFKMDKNILVTAPEEMRIQRALKRENANEADIKSRIRAQWSDDRKESLADFVVQNNEKNAILPQILEIHKALNSNTDLL